MPGAWGAVGEGFTPGERCDLQVNGSPIGNTTANAKGVALAAFAPHPVGDNTLEKLTMTGATSTRRAYSAIYFFRNTPAPPGQVQGRWESSTGSTQVVIADNLGFSPAPYTVLIDGRTVLSDTTTGNGLAVYSYTVPLARPPGPQPEHACWTAASLAASRGTIQPCTAPVHRCAVHQPVLSLCSLAGLLWLYQRLSLRRAGRAMRAEQRPLFPPRHDVTRGQLMKMVVNAAGLAVADPPSPTFADVPATIPSSLCRDRLQPRPDQRLPLRRRPASRATRKAAPTSAPATDNPRPIEQGHRPGPAYPLGFPPAPTFQDVPATDTSTSISKRWPATASSAAIPAAATANPATRRQRPYFRPGNSATRAQVAKFVTVAYGGP